MHDFVLKKYLLNSLKKAAPDKALLLFPEGSVTAGKLWADIDCLGAALYALGYRGKRIAAMARREYGYILLVLSCVCGRITIVPINEDLPMEEKEDILRRTDAAACFTGYEEIPELIEKGRRLLDEGNRDYTDDTVSPEDVSMIIFTSGTTGRSKGVPFLQRAWQPYTEWIPMLGWREETMGGQVLALPLFHLYAMAVMFFCLPQGIPMLFSAGLMRFADELKKLRPKSIFLVPAQADMLYRLIMEEREADPDSGAYSFLKRILNSGAALSVELVRNFSRLGIVVYSAYSMTESSGIAYDPISLACPKPGSAGRLFPGAKGLVRIDHPDSEGCGEIIVSREYTGVFNGYLDDPEETDKILRDGYLHTGDLGRIDEDGDLFIVGRIKNLIIRSNGENVAPEKLEKKIYALPRVRECIVYEEEDRLAVRIVPEDPLEGGSPEESYKLFQKRLYQLNRTLPAYEQIDRLYLDKELEKGSTGKLLRRSSGGGDGEEKEEEASRTPEVSVIVPVFNAEGTLERCVKSILGQTFAEFELLLIVDEGSTDKSVEEAERLTRLDPRVKLFRTPRCEIYEIRNIGLEKAAGTYIVFVDADDLIEPETLQKAVRAARISGCDLVIWDFDYEKEGRVYAHALPCPEGTLCASDYLENLSCYLKISHLVIWNKLFRRSLLNEKGIRVPKLSLWEDACFCLRYFPYIKSAYILHDVLYHYIDTAHSTTYRESERDGGRIMREAIGALMEHIDGCFKQTDAENREAYLKHLNMAHTRLLDWLKGPMGLRSAMLMEEGAAPDGDRREEGSSLEYVLTRPMLEVPGDRIALRSFPGPDEAPLELTYGELREHIERLGGALKEQGFLEHRIAVIMDNSILSLEAMLTVLCMGHGAVLIGPMETPEKLKEKLCRTDSALLICDKTYTRAVHGCGIPVWDFDRVKGIIDGEKNSTPMPLDDHVCMDGKTDALLLFTSGTTGADKCVIHSRKNVATMIVQCGSLPAHGPEQLLMLPSFHIYALQGVILYCMTEGLTLTLSAGPTHWEKELAAYPIREFFGVPAQATALFRLIGSEGLKKLSIKYVTTGGAAPSQETLCALSTAGIRCKNGYGSSEVGIAADDEEKNGEVLSRPLSCGKLLPGFAYRIKDPDREGVGELLLKSESIATAYLDEKKELSPVAKDGWYATGDLARVDEDGYLYIKGRVKDLIILSSGENVAPEELEKHFQTECGLSECLLFERDNRLCLLVVSEKSECMKDEGRPPEGTGASAELVKKLYQVNMGLPSWKRVSAFYLSDTLEKTATGKVKRSDLTLPDETMRLRMPEEGGEEKGTVLAAVREAFSEAFGRMEISPEDNFFALGGDSLCGMAISASLSEKGFPVSIREIFLYPECGELAAFLEKRKEQAVSFVAYDEEERRFKEGKLLSPGLTDELVSRILKGFDREEVEAVYPAKGLLHEDIAEDKRQLHLLGGFFIDQVFVLQGSLEQEEFLKRMREISLKHPVLRSEWVKEEDSWYQVVLKQKELPAFYEDRRYEPGSDGEKLKRILAEYGERYAVREKEELPRLFSAYCYRLGREKTVILAELTHTCNDGFSTGLLFTELLGGMTEGMDHYHKYRLCQFYGQREERREAAGFWAEFEPITACGNGIRPDHVRYKPWFIEEKRADPDTIRNLSGRKEEDSWKAAVREHTFVIPLEKQLSSRVVHAAAREHVTPSELISFAWYRSLMAVYGLQRLIFREHFTGRENLPFDARDIFGNLVYSAPCFLESSDSPADYHERLARLAEYSEPSLLQDLKKWEKAPILLNKLMFDRPWLSLIKSTFSPIKARTAYYFGGDILTAYLRQGKEDYRIEILHAEEREVKERMERVSGHFYAMLEKLA